MSSLPSPSSPPRVAFAGDRDVAVAVLDRLRADDVAPVALLLPSRARASHDAELEALCPDLPPEAVVRGPDAVRAPATADRLRTLDLDFLLSVHYPYLLPEALLALPRCAALNLHPAYLPYNRGWHTPSWALLDDTPIGATLHVMTPDVDAGPIVRRERLAVRPEDTAHRLYQRLRALEVAIFDAAWPALRAGEASLTTPSADGTLHAKDDLHTPAVQHIDPSAQVRAGALLRRLRALTTNRLDEAAYVEQDGTRYRIQVSITPEPDPPAAPDS
jgi:methionyl-tRNA formyltransferase